MMRLPFSGKAIVAQVIALMLLAIQAYAEDASLAPPAAQAQTSPVKVPDAGHKPVVKMLKNRKPQWQELSTQQQLILAPLASEWDQFSETRKEKWLVISNKYVAMPPSEQQRMQERMRDWIKLTPKQRQVVRKNYAQTRKMTPAQKYAQWEKYQHLSEDQKKKLAETKITKTVPPLHHKQEKAGRTARLASPTPPALSKTVSPLPPTSATPTTPVIESEQK